MDLDAPSVEAVEGTSRNVPEELRAIAGERGAKAVEDFHWRALGIGVGL